MTPLSNVNWRHGLKTAIAAGICLALVRDFRFPQGYWACISTIVVMQSESAATVVASRDRLAGTAIGTLVGWGMATIWHAHLLVYAIAVLLCMFIPEAFGLKAAGRLAGVAASIVMLVPADASYGTVARIRFLEVSFGIVVALIVSQALWRSATAAGVSPNDGN